MLSGPDGPLLRHIGPRIDSIDAFASIAGIALVGETDDAVVVVGLEEGQVRTDALEAFLRGCLDGLPTSGLVDASAHPVVADADALEDRVVCNPCDHRPIPSGLTREEARSDAKGIEPVSNLGVALASFQSLEPLLVNWFGGWILVDLGIGDLSWRLDV